MLNTLLRPLRPVARFILPRATLFGDGLGALRPVLHVPLANTLGLAPVRVLTAVCKAPGDDAPAPATADAPPAEVKKDEGGENATEA
ncbi:MAG: hypothetical protein P4L40_25510, partial [Terracidiphilus sp.]|nr:hypothetical protein [Terracidiphilus sp.]